MINPLERATQPDQYDSGDLTWRKEGMPDSGRTDFFWEYLKPYTQEWCGRSVFEIGSGTGWLLDEARKAGAQHVLGIEPSRSNVSEAQRLYLGISVVQSSFEDFDSRGEQFDIIVAVMSFSHIADVPAAFRKISSLLTEEGEAFIVVPDYEYFKTPRHEYRIETQHIDEDQYAVAVTRETGTIADIVRRVSVYERAAKAAGLRLIEDRGMKPTQSHIARSPKYATVQDQALTRLLHFRKEK